MSAAGRIAFQSPFYSCRDSPMLAPAPAGGHTQSHRGLQQVHASICRAAWKGCQCMATAGTGSTQVLFEKSTNLCSKSKRPSLAHRSGQAAGGMPFRRCAASLSPHSCGSKAAHLQQQAHPGRQVPSWLQPPPQELTRMLPPPGLHLPDARQVLQGPCQLSVPKGLLLAECRPLTLPSAERR